MDIVYAHSRLSALLGLGAEPLAVLQRAESHREYWKPKRVRVVLLAESHVFTEADELNSQLLPSPIFPDNMPLGFVRLVYSLGYGENELLTLPLSHPPNKGTPQFWKIFQHCIRSPGERADHATLQRTGNPNANSRLHEKIRVLNQLRERGVWLVDASIAALYLPGRKKPPAKLRETLLHTSWDTFTSGKIQTAEPQAILCIGAGVVRALTTRLARLGIPWAGVYQPQAHLSAEEHEHILATYAMVCTDPRSITDVARIA